MTNLVDKEIAKFSGLFANLGRQFFFKDRMIFAKNETNILRLFVSNDTKEISGAIRISHNLEKGKSVFSRL